MLQNNVPVTWLLPAEDLMQDVGYAHELWKSTLQVAASLKTIQILLGP